MPLKVLKKGGKYRIVQQATNKIDRFRSGKRKNKPVDFGGWTTKEQAIRQIRAINLSKLRKRRYMKK